MTEYTGYGTKKLTIDGQDLPADRAPQGGATNRHGPPKFVLHYPPRPEGCELTAEQRVEILQALMKGNGFILPNTLELRQETPEIWHLVRRELNARQRRRIYWSRFWKKIMGFFLTPR